jgi:FkbM family methyltransferase
MWNTLIQRGVRTALALVKSPAADPMSRLLAWPDSGRPIHEMPLIVDIGMNDGRDSLFYLKKGFRVVAIEANPHLVKQAQTQFASYLASGQLVIEPVGIAEKAGELTFYSNLDNDHWSSFDPEWGTRWGTTRYETIPVSCIPAQELFERHGIPYYLKIDIEGMDLTVVRALHDFKTRPRYISVEEHSAEYLAELWAVGCRKFKIVNQWKLFRVRCPNPPREGVFVDAVFNGFASGPFGEEAPGEWLTFGPAMERYIKKVRSPIRGYLHKHSWFDIHGVIE